MNMGYFILDENHNPKEVSLEEWGKQFNRESRIVEQTDTKLGYWVSTVFLGLDHNFSTDPNAKPILFETMVFDRNNRRTYKLGEGEWESMGEEMYMNRYHTWDEALKGHQEVVKLWSSRLRVWKFRLKNWLSWKMWKIKYTTRKWIRS